MFVIMDEAAVFFEAKSKSTVYHTGTRTVSVRGSGSSTCRVTACISVACGGTKLPLLFISKKKPNGHIERQLKTLLPQNIFCSCHDI